MGHTRQDVSIVDATLGHCPALEFLCNSIVASGVAAQGGPQGMAWAVVRASPVVFVYAPSDIGILPVSDCIINMSKWSQFGSLKLTRDV